MDTMQRTFVLHRDQLPSIPANLILLFDINYWFLVGYFITVFSYSETWDDINGAFETWSLEYGELSPDREKEMLEGIVELMEVYGHWNEWMGRVLHFLREPSMHWTIGDIECSPVSEQTIKIVVEWEYVEDVESIFSPDLSSPACNVHSASFNPQTKPIFQTYI